MKKIIVLFLFTLCAIGFASAADVFFSSSQISPSSGEVVSGGITPFTAYNLITYNASNIYDTFNDTIVNNTLWFNATTGTGQIVESNGELFISSGGLSGGGTAFAISRIFPLINNLTKVELPQVRFDFTGTGANSVTLSIGDVVIDSATNTGGTVSYTYNWTVERFNATSFRLYRDNVFNRTIAPTSSNISCTTSATDTLSQAACYLREVRYSTDLGYRLTNSTIYIWYQNSTIYNITSVNITGIGGNISTFNINITTGEFLWNVFTCGSNGAIASCGFGPSNLTFSKQAFAINNETYESSVYETNTSFFGIQITTIDSILAITPRFIYNDSIYLAQYSCANSNCTINVTIDVPAITSTSPETKNFYWSMQIFNGNLSFVQNSTVRTQTLNPITVYDCAGSSTNRTLVFTAYDEDNLTVINPFKFAGTFNYWLGTGTTYNNLSISNLSISTVGLCTNPNLNYKINSIIEYGVDSNSSQTQYVTRNYYINNATINTSSEGIGLYLLRATLSTSFILEVLGEDIQGVPNAYIYIQRYYPGDNQYRTVQIAKTDNNGKSVGFYKTETVDYQHIIVLNGTVVLVTEAKKIFGETNPFTITFYLVDALETPWEFFDDLSSFQYVFYFNQSLNQYVFTYVDTSGLFSIARLLVEKEQFSSGPITVCNTTSIQSAATIICDVSGVNGTLTGKAYIGRSPEKLIDLIQIIIDNALDIFGRFGLWLSAIIILGAYLATIYNLNFGLVFGLVVTIFINMTPLLSLPPLYIFGQIALTIMALVVINKR